MCNNDASWSIINLGSNLNFIDFSSKHHSSLWLWAMRCFLTKKEDKKNIVHAYLVDSKILLNYPLLTFGNNWITIS